MNDSGATGAVTRDAVGRAFGAATDWFVSTVRVIDPGQWEQPGLGVWTVRQLVGHASRALITVEEYFQPSCPVDVVLPPGADVDPVGDAGTSFLGTQGATQLHKDVAERGRQAGIELGPVPADTVSGLAGRVTALVRGAPDGALFVTRFGPKSLASYLCTRTVELVVHTVDICDACALDVAVPESAARITLAVMVETARRGGSGADVVRALGGRADLPSGFNVFG
jgi:uncharacterized protein (TIGR03083 family)